MKSKEEIEQLAENSSEVQEATYTSQHKITYQHGYIDGYTQCQEDMADIIKQAIEYGYQLRCNHKPINSGIDWVKEFNSLNKQD
jgi:flagellar biosynthesis/type III secretory pathway protein FliH